ncbi:MAG: glucosamine-6-phosphate deaminase [Dysgonamonadaceae bacterium]|jgi:glucosamine-6-phosphate deaminase|nr:glucosamine-6-phosphate deaminase [Dysgonamonadaceae bacterium]
MNQAIQSFKIDELQVYVYGSRAGMGLAAYHCYKSHVQRMLEKQAFIRSVFAAARSQNDFLEILSQDNDIDFDRIEAFHMDEYMSLGKDAPQNFGNFLRKAIFSKRPFRKVNYVQSDADDISAECARYEALLKEASLDIVSLGIGENGHIAFNDPHEASFTDPRWVRETTLDDICRQQQVNDGEFSGINEVPRQALTLTIPALMSCRYIVGIVPTERKAKAVYDMIYGPVSETCPASILRRHPNVTLFLDIDAAKLLKL